jgi:hypothetical protein
MSSAVKLILGVSFLAMATGFAACDNSSDPGGTAGGPISVGAGAANLAGATQAGGGAPTTSGGAPGTGGDDLPAGVPLTAADGWIAGDTNTLMVQGAFFAYADTFSIVNQMSDFTGANVCMSGSAAKVDLNCTIVAPATDCYGTYFGAAIGLNLKQPTDPDSGKGGTPAPYDATAIKGFAFDVVGSATGAIIPAASAFRFQVEDDTGVDYCNVPTKKIAAGPNTVNFTDLVQACYSIKTDPPNPVATTVQSKIVKIAWQVVTNTSSEVPYNFCITNLRALQ